MEFINVKDELNEVVEEVSVSSISMEPSIVEVLTLNEVVEEVSVSSISMEPSIVEVLTAAAVPDQPEVDVDVFASAPEESVEISKPEIKPEVIVPDIESEPELEAEINIFEPEVIIEVRSPLTIEGLNCPYENIFYPQYDLYDSDIHFLENRVLKALLNGFSQKDIDFVKLRRRTLQKRQSRYLQKQKQKQKEMENKTNSKK